MPTTFSVVIPAHNQAPELRQHLPMIMEQDYDDFEVIVVDIASTDETKDILENMEVFYPTLRHTHTPPSARDISLDRLALSLGIRSASNEWVVITHPNCRPATHLWLRSIDAHVKEGCDILLGAAKYDEQHFSWFDRKVGFMRLWNTISNFDHILGKNSAVRADGCNVAIRRSLFMEKDGFAEHLNLLAGAEELLVNQLSNYRNTAIVDEPQAIVIEDRMPLRRSWKKKRVFYMETRRHQRNTFIYRTKQNMKMLLPWMLLLCIIALYPTLLLLHPNDTMPIAIITGLIVLLSSILAASWIINLNKRARAIGYERSYISTAMLFLLMMPIWNLSAWLTYLFSPKNEFRKKFV